MNDSGTKKLRRELNSGLIGLVLLAILDRSGEDLYGYEIARRLADSGVSGSLFKSGSIYPVLRSMSAQGLLTSRIVPSYAGPARRYYRISAAGRSTFSEWKGLWRDTCDFVARFIEPR